MRKLLFFLLSISMTTLSWSQNTDWELYQTINGVNIYTQSVDCNAKNIPDQKAVLIKVENTNGQSCRVEWDEIIWYNGVQHTQNVASGENHAVVNLTKNEIQEGECDVPRGALYIFSDFITYDSDTKLTKFELQNIKVTLL